MEMEDETPKWIQDAREAIRASSKESSIYVGCDSDRFKKKGLWYIKFATVIIVHKESKHGAVIYHNVEVVRDYSNSLRMKLMQEVQYAIDATFAIIDDIGERHLEIHLDLNASPKHKSNEAVKEALGYVKGMFGIDAKIKPFAPAASYAGDHFCRGKHLN
jgi:uncharacterized protein